MANKPTFKKKHTHTHTHTHIYMCVCVCVFENTQYPITVYAKFRFLPDIPGPNCCVSRGLCVCVCVCTRFKTNTKLLLTTGYKLWLAIDYQTKRGNSLPLETETLRKEKKISSTKRKNDFERAYTQILGAYLTIFALFLFKKQRTSRKRGFRLWPRLFWDVTHRRLILADVLAQRIGPIFKSQAVQIFWDCLTLDDGPDRLCRNVCNILPINAMQIPEQRRPRQFA